MKKAEVWKKVQRFPWGEHTDWITEERATQLGYTFEDLMGKPDIIPYYGLGPEAQIGTFRQIIFGTTERCDDAIFDLAPGQWYGDFFPWSVPWPGLYIDLMMCDDFQHAELVAADLPTWCLPLMNATVVQALAPDPGDAQAYVAALDRFYVQFHKIYDSVLSRTADLEMIAHTHPSGKVRVRAVWLTLWLRRHLPVVAPRVQRAYLAQTDAAIRKEIIDCVVRLSPSDEGEGLRGSPAETEFIQQFLQHLAQEEHDPALRESMTQKFAQALAAGRKERE